MAINRKLYFLRSRLQLAMIIIISFMFLSSVAWAIPSIPEIPSFPTITSPGSTYHVNKDTGKDGNVGSSVSPWATIQYAVNQLTAGDTLIVHEAGTPYAGEKDISINGTSSNWITIKGADGERPTWSGTGSLIDIQGTSAYVYLKNFDIISTGEVGVRLRNGSHHIVLDDLDIDGGTYGVIIGQLWLVGAKDCYIRNVKVHDSSNRGFFLLARSERIVFDGCEAYDNGDDGFASHLEVVGHSDPDVDVLRDIYYVNCYAYNNADGGYDLGVVKGVTVFKNCKSIGNTSGFKAWGQEVWVINCIANNNHYSGFDVKPVWNDSPFYFIGNTFVNNNTGGYSIGEIRVIRYRAKPVLPYGHIKTPLLYIYNNIFMTSSNHGILISSDGDNISFVEEDYNVYFKPGDETYGYKEFDGDWNEVKAYDVKEMGDGTWYAAEGVGQHNIGSISGSDPGFTDLANNDFSLKDTSLAVDNGAIIPSLVSDIINKERPSGANFDIGAYEYQYGMNSKLKPEPPKNLAIK